MIGIVDYGAGNLLSVGNALDYLGRESVVVRGPGDLGKVEKLILPGVGAFGAAMRMLREKEWVPALLQWIEEDKPFLGICLGMQVLFEQSEESPRGKGLGVFKGDVPRFHQGRVPQIGWNQVRYNKGSKLFKGIDNGSFFYFLHSYYVRDRTGVTTAVTDYVVEYTSAVERGSVYGVQFHPEKSGEVGLKLLKNWVIEC